MKENFGLDNKWYLDLDRTIIEAHIHQNSISYLEFESCYSALCDYISRGGEKFILLYYAKKLENSSVYFFENYQQDFYNRRIQKIKEIIESAENNDPFRNIKKNLKKFK